MDRYILAEFVSSRGRRIRTSGAIVHVVPRSVAMAHAHGYRPHTGRYPVIIPR